MSEITQIQGSLYVAEDRQRAMILFAVHGNMTRVSREIGIAQTTLSDWKNTEWWKDQFDSIRAEQEEGILSRNLAIAEASQLGLLERMELGDVVRIQDGVEVRMPIKARDLAIIGGIAQDKAVRGMGKPTSITANVDRLNDLAAQFRALVATRTEKVVASQGEDGV